MVSLRLDSVELERISNVEKISRLSKSQIFRTALYSYLSKEFSHLI